MALTTTLLVSAGVGVAVGATVGGVRGGWKGALLGGLTGGLGGAAFGAVSGAAGGTLGATSGLFSGTSGAVISGGIAGLAGGIGVTPRQQSEGFLERQRQAAEMAEREAQEIEGQLKRYQQEAANEDLMRRRALEEAEYFRKIRANRMRVRKELAVAPELEAPMNPWEVIRYV